MLSGLTVHTVEKVPTGCAGSGSRYDPAQHDDRRNREAVSAPRGPGGRSVGRAATLVLVALGSTLVLAGVISALAISHNRSFQVDEVEHLHAAYNIADGRALYRDFWQSHNPLLHLVLRPLVDVEDPVGTYRRGRVLIAALMFCTIGLSAWTAGRLGGPAAGVMAAGLLLFETTFVERGIEVRPDNLVALTVAGALALQVSSIRESRRFCLQGLLLGVGFLATSKAAVVTVAFGVLWVVSAVRRRKPFLLVGPVASWMVPVLAAAAFLAGLGLLDDWSRWNVKPYFLHVSRSLLPDLSFSPRRFLLADAGRNVFFYASSLLALAYVTVLTGRRRPEARPLWFPAGLALTCLAFLWLNPFPFPYNFVTVLPTHAVLGGTICGLAVSWFSARTKSGSAATSIVVLFLALAALPTASRRFSKSLEGNAHQFATLRAIQRVTAPDDRVYDAAGMYFRPDAYPVYAMTGVGISKYRLGLFPPIIPALLENEVTAYIYNYRIRLLPDAEKRFLGEHFVRYDGAVMVLGTVVRGLQPGMRLSFRVLKEKPFRYSGDGQLLVDGFPFEAGVLTRGIHVLGAARPIELGLLGMDVPPPAEGGSFPERLLFEPFD